MVRGMSIDEIVEHVDYIVPPMVRRIPQRAPNTSILPTGLRERVEQALGAVPIDPQTHRAVRARMRRVFLGPRGFPFDAGNRFLQRTYARNDGTEAVYASAIRMWIEFCSAHGTDPLAVNFDTLLEYRDDVRLEIDCVSAGTWNHNLIPLKWFSESGHAAGLMDHVPASDWRALRLTDTSVRWPRVVDPAEYRRFRAVGIQALSLNGAMTPSSHSIKTPLRDSLFADFLILHGARRAEASHLTLLDLPLRREGYARNIGYLPPAICKWGSGRDFEEVASWVKRLSRYHDSEWLTTIAEAQRNLRRMERDRQLLVVTGVTNRFGRNTNLTIRGIGKRNLVNLSTKDRRSLVCMAGVAREIAAEPGMGRGLQMVEDDWIVPLAVFPGVRAPMPAPEAWSMTFREANYRVVRATKTSDLPEPRRITPHMLRHTFATEWLSAELDRIAEHDRDFALAAMQGDHAALRRRHMNPLVRMMRLLGHRRLDTTLLYIDYLMREQQTAFMPGDSWIESFVGDS